jgi:signal transduction histidine kinase/ActR/RegA family two-component response regulator
MREAPTFDDVFAVMSAASVGDTAARVSLPAMPEMDDPATRLGVALNILLDDLALRTSDLRESEERLRQAQKMEAIGRLAGGVAHDFNNILTAVVGFGSILADSLPDGDERQMAHQIVEAGERAAALTRQLLALGRRQILTPRVIDPAEVIAALTPLVKRIIGEDIEFTALSTSEPLRVRADPTQLEQVLVNLVANARDAMRSGGKLTVEVAEVELDGLYATTHPEVVPGPYVMIAVSDTGSGMSDEVREHVFEPFYTTKEGSGGTGLGLATVYGIVKQSGGSIGVYSEPGRGAAFKVYLPRVFETLEERAASVVEPEIATGTETILIAEDDEAVRGIAVLTLSRAGYQVLAADSGPTALQLAADHAGPIHLLVTDVVMREMSGRQLAEELGRLRPELPILYMSGYTENTIVHHGVLDPEVEFLAKPFTPTALVHKVRELLAPRGTEGAARRSSDTTPKPGPS